MAETETRDCQACGMADCQAPKYHPFAACMMFKADPSGDRVEANLRGVVAYGIRAGKLGLTLDQAMNDIALIYQGDSNGKS